jgi:GT2 family glycosyltransferase
LVLENKCCFSRNKIYPIPLNGLRKIPVLDIVIVNWNSGRQLADALHSIREHHEGKVSKVIIVDNNSTDNSLALINEEIQETPFFVQVIHNTVNLGFGAACNQGAAEGVAPFILFLNPDAKLHANSLSRPLDYMSKRGNDDVGICGVQLVDELGSVARSCSRFPSLNAFVADALGLTRVPALRFLGNSMTDWRHDTTREVDQVIGAFFLIRRPIFEALEGFDKRFFVYYEEVDLALRAKRAGWKSVYLADVQAFHAGGGTSNKVKATRLFYSLRSRLLYGLKHFSFLRAALLLSLTLFVEPITRSIFFLMRGRITDVHETVEGYAALYRAMPEIIKGKGS